MLMPQFSSGVKKEVMVVVKSVGCGGAPRCMALMQRPSGGKEAGCPICFLPSGTRKNNPSIYEIPGKER
jgi:hypothetical protein